MNEVIYRVILKVGYCDAFFEFESVEDAAAFARVALKHMVSNEDTKKKSKIILEIISPIDEESEDE